MQERVESSDLGRALISAFLLVTLVVVLAANLPAFHDSELKRQLSRVQKPYLQATGLDQSWTLFAPEPLNQNNEFRAVVTFADGSQATWTPPRFDPFVGSFRAGRWAKWVEVVRKDAYRGPVFESVARWVARRYAADGRRPVKVTFVRFRQPLAPPGSGRTEPWQSESYYELVLADGP